jgi:hypothetical protein
MNYSFGKKNCTELVNTRGAAGEWVIFVISMDQKPSGYVLLSWIAQSDEIQNSSLKIYLTFQKAASGMKICFPKDFGS